MKKKPLVGRFQILADAFLLMAVIGLLNPAIQARETKSPALLEKLNPLIRADYYRALVHIEPWHTEAWDWILTDDAGREDWQVYIRDGETAIRWQAISNRGLLLMGDSYALTGDKEKAVDTWRKVSGAEMDESQKRIVKTQCELRDYAGALETLDSWIERSSNDANIYYQKGVLLALDHPAEANAFFEKAAILDKSYEAQYQAWQKMAEFIQADPDDGYARIQTGRMLLNWGQVDISREIFSRLVKQKPEYAEAWAFLGEAQRQLGEDELAALEKAIELDPRSVSAQSLMGMYWLRHNDPQEAENYFRRLSVQEPQQAVWQAQWGESLARQGQPAYAMVHYQQALEMEPGNPDCWRMMVQFCLDYSIEVRRIGLPAARRLVVLTPADPLVYDLHGQVLWALGDGDNAISAFQRGLTVDPGNPILLLDMGEFSLNKANYADAFIYLTRAASNARQSGQKNIYTRAQALLDQLP